MDLCYSCSNWLYVSPGNTHPAHPSCCPAGLEIESSGDGIDIQDFPHEIESRMEFGFHRFVVYLREFDPSGGDEFLAGFSSDEREGDAVGEKLHDRPAFVSGYMRGTFFSVYSDDGYHHFGKSAREIFAENISDGSRRVCFEVLHEFVFPCLETALPIRNESYETRCFRIDRLKGEMG